MKSSLAFCIILLATVGTVACSPAPASLTVSVAASLQNAMSDLTPDFERANPGMKVNFNFGGSGTLEQQIERGAPVDVFFSAAPKPLDALEAKGLILKDTRHDLVRNRLVLVAAAGSESPAAVHDLAGNTVRLIALGDPDSVPAGEYGRQSLRALGLWQQVQQKLVLAKDVRQVLSYVETGNADAGIVYATDARESTRVRVVETLPEESHAPIVYPIAVVKDSRNAAAARTFVRYLSGSNASAVFARHGFTAVTQ